MRSLRLCWRFNEDATNELRNSRLRPTGVYLVVVLAFNIFLVFPLAYLLTGQFVHEYWTSFWFKLGFFGASPVLWYLLANLLFDAIILILLVFLPIFTILIRNKCPYSAREFGKCFVLFALPTVFLWHILMFFLAPTALVIESSGSTSLWKHAVETSVLAQYLGLLTTTFGLLNTLRPLKKET